MSTKINLKALVARLREYAAELEANYVDGDIDALTAGATYLDRLSAPDAHPDDVAVDAFAERMKAKLRWEREERGRSGWQSMSASDLSKLLVEHIPKGDPVDVANLAMMLGMNEQRIVLSAPDAGVGLTRYSATE